MTWAELQSIDNNDILSRKSTNNGIKFDTAINLSNNAEDSGSPVIAVSQKDVYIVWDDRTGSILGRDVFFIRSTNGEAFGATTIIIPNAGSSDMAVSKNIA